MIGAHPDDEDTSPPHDARAGVGGRKPPTSPSRAVTGGRTSSAVSCGRDSGSSGRGSSSRREASTAAASSSRAPSTTGTRRARRRPLSLWPREDLLADVVWAVRSYRPHVIVSVFSGTPRDGHGQHQAAGIIAREAFEAAGDPEPIPRAVCTRRPAVGSRAVGPGQALSVVSPSFLRSWVGVGVAMGCRRRLAHHRDRCARPAPRTLAPPAIDGKSQPAPIAEHGGRSAARTAEHRVVLVESRVEDDGATIFSGVDTTLVGLTESLPADVRATTRAHLEAYRASVGRAIGGFGLDLSGIVLDLAEASRHIVQARQAAGRSADTEFRQANRSEEGSGQSGTLRRRRNLFRCPGYGRPAGAG